MFSALSSEKTHKQTQGRTDACTHGGPQHKNNSSSASSPCLFLMTWQLLWVCAKPFDPLVFCPPSAPYCHSRPCDVHKEENFLTFTILCSLATAFFERNTKLTLRLTSNQSSGSFFVCFTVLWKDLFLKWDFSQKTKRSAPKMITFVIRVRLSNKGVLLKVPSGCVHFTFLCLQKTTSIHKVGMKRRSVWA